ncbi:hypothetical protein [Neisseria sp. Ec49-e6-T10]|uniref:hypothetical protein n=1 Tax=Neisseria sp. Ec49-e6-T10 TaxID=3140744 RepID=UPI003EBB7C34
MIRNAIYTVYDGVEYRIFCDRYGKYILVSHDKDDESKGFIREDDQEEIYLKDITPSEVSEVYGINTFGIYKGCEVGVRMDDKTGDKVLLGVGDAMIASKLEFEFDERGVYMKWVPRDEVYLFEKKEPMPNYFK